MYKLIFFDRQYLHYTRYIYAFTSAKSVIANLQVYEPFRQSTISCKGVSRIIQRLLRSRGRTSTVHCVVFGFDSITESFSIFEHLPNGAPCIEQNFVCAGRGSSCILGYIEGGLSDVNFCASTIPIVRQALQISQRTDCLSGGQLRMAVLNKDGQLEEVKENK